MNLISLCVVLFVSSVYAQWVNEIKHLETPFAWKNLVFGFPSKEERRDALFYGFLRSDKVIPLDVDMTYAGGNGRARFFVSIPRFGEGVPYSLAEVTNVTRRNGPLLTPYPSYDWHNSRGGNCGDITSVYRFAIDDCDRMWILDSGTIGFRQICPPQLIVFDLNTDTEIDRYVIPRDMYKAGKSLLVTPIVDVADPPPGRCRRTKVYMADSTGHAIIVHDNNKRDSWRIENPFTTPDSRFSTHTIAGESFQLGDGVFGMSLTPRSMNTERYLYFHALASDSEMTVPLGVVNNPELWKRWNGYSDQFRRVGNRGIQCTVEAMSSDGYQFCAYNDPIGIFAWDIRTSYERRNRLLVALNPETLQFVSGMKVVRNRDGQEELLLLSNRLQKYYGNTMDYNDINYRVQACRVSDLLNGAECQSYL